jgi:hypothetical protein
MLSGREQERKHMPGDITSDLKLNVRDVEKIVKSLDLTEEHARSEGFDGPSDEDATLREFCDLLLRGGDVTSFLVGQDMVVPE